MGMFLGVTRGSAEPPRLVTVSYRAEGRRRAKRRPVVLVGKAITFDSGGLSLKPTESMVTMNTDMAGSAAVLGAMRVVAPLRPDAARCTRCSAPARTCRAGRAYKPSDVLVAYDGKTVEITNTDAEGRLVLGDVLAWAAETFEAGGDGGRRDAHRRLHGRARPHHRRPLRAGRRRWSTACSRRRAPPARTSGGCPSSSR